MYVHVLFCPKLWCYVQLVCMQSRVTAHFTHVVNKSAHTDLFTPVPADCGCDPAGTAGSSVCDSSGQCNCKANVEGLQCTECGEGFWNLTADNVLGCQGKTECWLIHTSVVCVCVCRGRCVGRG